MTGHNAAGKFAVLAKTTRNATIGFVVLGYALYWAKRSQTKEIANRGRFLWQKFPKFDLRQMRKQGFRPFIVGAIGEFAIAGLTMVLILAAAPLLKL